MTIKNYSISTNYKTYSWLNAGIFQLFLGCIALVSLEIYKSSDWLYSACFNLISGIFILISIIRAFRLSGNNLLVDHLLILSLMYFIYFVFGALLLQFGPKDEIAITLDYYRIDAQMALKVASVNCIGFGLALVGGSILSLKGVKVIIRSAIGKGSKIPPYKIIILFIFIGGVASIFTVVSDLGYNSDIVSNTWRSLSQLIFIAIFMAAAYSGKYSRFLFIVAIIISLLQISIGIILLNKSIVLQSLAVFLVGVAWRLNSLKILILSFFVIISIYIAISGPISQARNTIGIIDKVSISERIEIMSDLVRLGIEVTENERYGYWSRFSYVVPQGAAIDFYDQGQGGNDFTLLWWTFLPRVFFPHKPIITSTGQDFHFKITGSVTSSTGQGVFINGYYNLGWMGVIIVGLLVGLILSITSALAVEIFKARALVWMPFALLGVYMGFRIDGHFVSDYWGPLGMLIYVILAGLFLQKVIYKNY